jgi:hypothetical protein
LPSPLSKILKVSLYHLIFSKQLLKISHYWFTYVDKIMLKSFKYFCFPWVILIVLKVTMERKLIICNLFVGSGGHWKNYKKKSFVLRVSCPTCLFYPLLDLHIKLNINQGKIWNSKEKSLKCIANFQMLLWTNTLYLCNMFKIMMQVMIYILDFHIKYNFVSYLIPPITSFNSWHG